MQQPTQTERALLRAARTVAAAFDVEEITAEITAAALELTGASGAYVERVVSADGLVTVIANAGEGTPPHGMQVPFPGSLTEDLITSGEPMMMDTLVQLGTAMAPYFEASCRDCAGLVVPLLSEGDVVGSLVLLKTGPSLPSGAPAFSEHDATSARLLGDLASVALRRVAREAVIRERQERFQSLAGNAAEAIVSLDTNDRILFANPAAERIFGYSGEELLQMPFTNLIPERYREQHRRGMQHYMDTEQRRIPWDGVELVGLHRDGHEIPLDVTFGEFRQGNQRLFTGLMRDITERKRIEAERDRLFARESELRAAAEREGRRSRFLATASVMLSSSLDLPTTLQNLANLAIEVIADWCVIDVATSADVMERVAGAHKDESRLPLVRDLMRRFPPETGSDNPAVRSLNAGEPVVLNSMTEEKLLSISRNAEHARLVADIGVHSLMSVPLGMSGEYLGVITFVRDRSSGTFDEADVLFAQDLATRAALAISNARHYSDAEASRAQAEQDRLALERAIEGKSRLIRGFSHDIKNPLGAADGYAQLLLDGLMGELSQKQHESLQRIRAGIATALGLINDVVEFSRAETGQIEVRPSPFNADALVREIVAEHHAAAEQAGTNVRAGVLQGGQLTCDAIRIRQILSNLVSNAIKYGGSDEGVVVSAEREDEPHPRILFSVTDRGAGIPAEKQHLLFEEFTRLHTGKKEGSGLGLAISRRIARVLGGDILVDSTEGRGSTFTLWIPVSQQD
jgi:PAS domain S-box-containing protein